MPFISIRCLFVDNPLHKVLYMFILTLYKCVFSYTYIMVIDDLCKLAFFSSAASTKTTTKLLCQSPKAMMSSNNTVSPKHINYS